MTVTNLQCLSQHTYLWPENSSVLANVLDVSNWPPHDARMLTPSAVQQGIEDQQSNAALDKVGVALAEAIRQEILAVVSTGDTSRGGAFTPETAAQVARIAEAAQQLLLARRLAAVDAIGAMKKNKTGWLGPAEGYVYPGTIEMPMSSTSSGPENFGTRAVREIVEVMKLQNESPEKVVRAIAEAKSLGLNDLATTLENRLTAMMPSALPPMPPTADAPANGSGR